MSSYVAGTYFNSISLSLTALIYMVLILIMFIKKKTKINITSGMFLLLLGMVIISSLLEVACSYTIMNIDSMEGLNTFICKLYMYSIYILDNSFLLYIICLLTDINKFKKRNNYERIVWLVVALALLVPLAMVLFLDIEFVGGVNGAPYTVHGTIMYMYYLSTFIGLFITIWLLSKNDEKIQNINMLPLYCSFILFLTVMLLQLIFNYQINFVAFFASIIVAILFFTIESQDNKLLYDYRKSKAEAEKANKAKTEFLINMSHEIRTPMNTILGFGESLLNDENLTEEVLKRDLQSINSASATLMDLINNILDISRLESGKEVLNNSDYLLENLIFEINSLIPSKIQKEELKFSIEVDENMPKGYYGDPYKLFKIVTYVLINAIEYTNYGEVKLNVFGNMINNNIFEFNFLIANTGHAMSYEIFNRNFEDFVDIQNSQSNNIDNIKLGIIIAKQLTEMMHGRIDFINEKGQGTKYIVKIRQRIRNIDPIGNVFEGRLNEKEGTKKLIDCTGKKVLVVDDSDINLKLTSRYLSQFNFEIDTATSGRECVEKCRSTKYDLIFLDRMMPDMDGVTTLKSLNSLGIILPPVVALTANSFDDSKETYVAEGFTNYLRKPIILKDLSKVINDIFNVEE